MKGEGKNSNDGKVLFNWYCKYIFLEKIYVFIVWREEGDNNKKIKGVSFGCVNLIERVLEVGSF